MCIFFTIYILIVILDVKELLKYKKELWIYIVGSLITFSVAIFYYSNIFEESFISNVLKFLNLQN